jgi:hypothetical protein
MWQINKRVHHQPSGRSTGLVWSFGLNNPLKQVQPTSNQQQGDTWRERIFEHPQKSIGILFGALAIVYDYATNFHLLVQPKLPSSWGGL